MFNHECIDSIDDEWLRNKLIENGLSPGPILPSTKLIYVKLLKERIKDPRPTKIATREILPRSKPTNQSTISLPKTKQKRSKTPVLFGVCIAIFCFFYFKPFCPSHTTDVQIGTTSSSSCYFVVVSFVLIAIVERMRIWKAEKIDQLADEVIQELKSQPNQPIPVLHIRDTLLSREERRSSTWNSVEKIIQNESTIQTVQINIDGEDYKSWKFIGNRCK